MLPTLLFLSTAADAPPPALAPETAPLAAENPDDPLKRLKVSADGRTIYVNFNGHVVDDLKPAAIKKMTPGFGCTGFAAIHLADE